MHVRGQAPDTRVQTPHGTPRLEEKNYTRHVRPHRVEKDGRHMQWKMQALGPGHSRLTLKTLGSDLTVGGARQHVLKK